MTKCKIGDLVVLTNVACPEYVRNIGMLGEVLRPYPADEPAWVLKSLSPFYSKGKLFPAGTESLAKDKRLRPLRGGPGQDETLEWLNKPQSEENNNLCKLETNGKS